MPSRFPTVRPTLLARALRAALATAFVSPALLPLAVQAQTVSAPTPSPDVQTLQSVTVRAEAPISAPTPTTYGGGQVATGGQMGILGNLDIMEAPFTISSYTSKLVQDQQARTLGDVLKNDSSVQVGNGFGNQAQTFVIRGFALNNDDLSFNGLYGILPRQVLPTQMVERVEVFKGASGFLNGAAPGGSGLGGLINIQPKRATDDPISRVDVDYTSRGQFGGGVDIGRRWGADNQFGVRVNAAHRDGETSVKDADERISMGSVGLDFRGERLRVSVDAGAQRVRYDHPRSAIRLSSTDVPSAPETDVNYGQSWAYSDLESRFLVGRAEFDINNNWMAYAAIGTSTDEEEGLYATPTVGGDGIGTQGYLNSPYRRDSVTGETGLRGRFNTGSVGHRVNLNVSALKQIGRTAYASPAFGTPASPQNIHDPVQFERPAEGPSVGDLNDPPRSERTILRSVTLSDTLSFMDERLLVTIGARHQSIDQRTYGAFGSAYDDSVISPMGGIVFRATDNLSVYANYIQGLARGEVAPNNAANPGELFKPARTKQIEAGVKADFGDYGASFAVFQIQRPDFYQDINTNIFSDAGRQRNRGVELNVYGEPMTGLRLIGGITLMQAKLRNTNGGLQDGNYARGVPKYQAVLGAEYDLPALQGLTLQGHVSRRGAQYIDINNSAEIPAWTRVDLGARYTTKLQGKEVTWRLGVDNVFDKKYWATVAPQFGQITAGTGRVYKATMSVAF
ncbi:TonB-dependent receptor [Orrella dioscoreae]|uniref:Ferrichrome-iron receptor n=1 Tax=Orrella dioscoreae TaxID=1851544 RepID=A0A1C3K4J8_9BURK|nr:TonB-dependent siderophore receptor [Orrella dioscoreae]SBT26420.1 Ferrichrome-iron receptor [Orrella dioscoreae]SOE46659.1 Ferrichrome-iron receptor [Orrella dioscoreae]